MKQEILNEIELLLVFGEQSSQQGIKIHSEASASMQEAAKRLYDKGLITQTDGGYLTDRGKEAVDHSLHLVSILERAD